MNVIKRTIETLEKLLDDHAEELVFHYVKDH